MAHCAINAVIYRNGARRWALTERGGAAVGYSHEHLRVGPSAMHWRGDALEVLIDERAAPLPARLRGRVTLYPETLNGERFSLDAAGRHYWQPIAPRARVEVMFDEPRLCWKGSAYMDHNAGAEPIEAAFSRWDWSRSEGEPAAVLYDVQRRDGTRLALALRIDADGCLQPLEAPPFSRLPRTFWGMPRQARAEPAEPARVIRTLEDSPFYTRSLIRTRLAGQSVLAIHESLDLERWQRPWVQRLLPFRMPRARRAPAG
jgi:carotenoid 1,2-hydratase